MQTFERSVRDEPATQRRVRAGIDGALPTRPPSSPAETTVDVFRERLLRAQHDGSRGDDHTNDGATVRDAGLRFHIGENDDGIVLVRPDGDIDIATRDQLRNALESFHGDVELDMGSVTLLDSSGISALMLQRVRLEALGHALYITNAPRAVRDPLTLVGLGDWLE